MSDEKQNVSEQKFVAQVTEALDASVDRIDAETCQKINVARRRALEQNKRKSFFAPTWNKTVLAAALSIFVAVLVVKTQFQAPIEEENIEAMELMAAQDTLDLYEELEFYTWLAEEDVAT